MKLTTGAQRLSRQRAQRGAATVEAVIAFPVFVIVFLALTYMRDQALATQAAEQQARTCAWLYSAKNCEGEIPAGCAGVLGDPHTPDLPDPDVGGALDEGLSGLKQGGSGGDLVSGVVSQLLGPMLLAAFGREVDAEATRTVERSTLFGEGQKVVQGRYHLACNLTPTTPEDVAKGAWAKLVPW